MCDPIDPNALAAAAHKLLADPEPYRLATRRAVERYQWSVEEQHLLDVYSSLAD